MGTFVGNGKCGLGKVSIFTWPHQYPPVKEDKTAITDNTMNKTWSLVSIFFIYSPKIKKFWSYSDSQNNVPIGL